MNDNTTNVMLSCFHIKGLVCETFYPAIDWNVLLATEFLSQKHGLFTGLS